LGGDLTPAINTAIDNFINERDGTVIYETSFTSWTINMRAAFNFTDDDTVNLFLCNNIDEDITSMCVLISRHPSEKEILVNRNIKINSKLC